MWIGNIPSNNFTLYTFFAIIDIFPENPPKKYFIRCGGVDSRDGPRDAG